MPDCHKQNAVQISPTSYYIGKDVTDTYLQVSLVPVDTTFSINKLLQLIVTKTDDVSQRKKTSNIMPQNLTS